MSRQPNICLNTFVQTFPVSTNLHFARSRSSNFQFSPSLHLPDGEANGCINAQEVRGWMDGGKEGRGAKMIERKGKGRRRSAGNGADHPGPRFLSPYSLSNPLRLSFTLSLSLSLSLSLPHMLGIWWVGVAGGGRIAPPLWQGLEGTESASQPVPRSFHSSPFISNNFFSNALVHGPSLTLILAKTTGSIEESNELWHSFDNEEKHPNF